MTNSKTTKSIIYYLFSIIGAGLLIYIAELIKFSHLNLAPFGGKSWAIWFHPLSFLLSFLIVGKIMKVKKTIAISLIVLVVMVVAFYYIYNGKLFVNPVPFGL